MPILDTAVLLTTSFTADGHDYVVDVEEVDWDADSDPLLIVSPITIRRGDPSYSPLEPILYTQVSFTIRDDAGYLRGRFATLGANKHLLKITRDAELYFRGYIDTRFQSKRAWHDNPTLSIVAFDGLQLLDGASHVDAGAMTVREQLFSLLDATGLGLVINYACSLQHDGTDAGTEPPDALRWRAEDMLEDTATKLEALTAICEFFVAQLMQVRGAWWFVRRSDRGAVLTVYPTDNTGAADTSFSLDPDYTATDELLLRDSTEEIEYPSAGLVRVEQSFVDRGLRNNDFAQGSRFWAVGGFGTGGAQATADGGWEFDVTGQYVEQEVGYSFTLIDVDFDRLFIHTDLSFDVFSAASGAPSSAGELSYMQVILLEQDGTVSYHDGAGAWTPTPTFITHAFNLHTTAGTTVNEPDVYHVTPVVPSTPCKMIIRYECDLNPDSDSEYITAVRINKAWLVHGKPEAPEDIVDRPENVVYTENIAGGGDKIQQVFQIGDTYPRVLRPGTIQYYDGADWLFATDWDGLGEKIHRLRRDEIVDQVGARIPGYEFVHVWGAEVDALSSLGYAGKVHVPTFEERILYPVGAHSARIAGYEILGVAHAPRAPAGTVFFASRAGSSNSLVTSNSLCRRNLDGSVDILYTFVGSEPTALCLDSVNRRIYTVQGQKIWGCFYDGTGMDVVYEHSGNTVYGIDFMPAGTYAGYLFYTTYATGNDNDRLHRVTVTGTDQANVGNTMTAIPQPVVVSSVAVFMNAAFSTISIVSMPAAGGSYSTVKSGQTFNAIGLAVDVSGDRIWTTSNGDLEQTNFAGAAYTTVGSINNGTLPWWDATGARLFYGGLGLRYRAGGALGTELALSPTTGGSGPTGSFSVNQIVAVQ